jgi:hypothetical protein
VQPLFMTLLTGDGEHHRCEPGRISRLSRLPRLRSINTSVYAQVYWPTTGDYPTAGSATTCRAKARMGRLERIQ